jgi:uncharacterized membrane protein YdjX (TVP38/TMEM64 family)
MEVVSSDKLGTSTTAATLPLKQSAWLGVLTLATLGGPILGGVVFLSAVAAEPSLWSSQLNLWMIFLYAMGGAILVGSALMPSFLLAGYLGYVSNGSPTGFALALLSLIIATSFGIFLGRRLASGSLESILAIKPRWLVAFRELQSKEDASLLVAIFLARLAPQVPFALTNLMLGQLRLPLRKLILSSWLGLIPRTLVAMMAGVGMTQVSGLLEAASAIHPTELALGSSSLVLSLIVAVVALKRKRKRSPKQSMHI